MPGGSLQVLTDRLCLRPIEHRDADALASVYSHPEVGQFVGALDRAATQEQVQAFVREWEELGLGIFAVIDRMTGEFIGRSGLHYWPQFDEVEVGWVLRRDRWGCGYGTEAGAASMSWGFEERRLSKITAIVATTNAGSIAVAERLRMQPRRYDKIHGWDVVVYAAERSPLWRPASQSGE